MKKMTKWLAVCAVCVMGSVPAMATDGSGVKAKCTVTVIDDADADDEDDDE